MVKCCSRIYPTPAVIANVASDTMQPAEEVAVFPRFRSAWFIGALGVCLVEFNPGTRSQRRG
jgi:hypothetical protein